MEHIFEHGVEDASRAIADVDLNLRTRRLLNQFIYASKDARASAARDLERQLGGTAVPMILSSLFVFNDGGHLRGSILDVARLLVNVIGESRDWAKFVVERGFSAGNRQPPEVRLVCFVALAHIDPHLIEERHVQELYELLDPHLQEHLFRALGLVDRTMRSRIFLPPRRNSGSIEPAFLDSVCWLLLDHECTDAEIEHLGKQVVALIQSGQGQATEFCRQLQSRIGSNSLANFSRLLLASERLGIRGRGELQYLMQYVLSKALAKASQEDRSTVASTLGRGGKLIHAFAVNGVGKYADNPDVLELITTAYQNYTGETHENILIQSALFTEHWTEHWKASPAACAALRRIRRDVMRIVDPYVLEEADRAVCRIRDSGRRQGGSVDRRSAGGTNVH